jgi:hypothetical protein
MRVQQFRISNVTFSLSHTMELESSEIEHLSERVVQEVLRKYREIPWDKDERIRLLKYHLCSQYGFFEDSV